jgi:hypothetical protein
MPASSVVERRVRYREKDAGIFLYIILFGRVIVRCAPLGFEYIESAVLVSRVLLVPLVPMRIRVAYQ